MTEWIGTRFTESRLAESQGAKLRTVSRGDVWAVALDGRERFAEPVIVLDELAPGTWRCHCLNLDRDVVVFDQHFLHQLPATFGDEDKSGP